MKKTILFFAGFLALSNNLTAWNWPWKKTTSVDDKQLELQRKQIDDPTNPYINYNIGVASYKKKQYGVASSSFERAIQNAPDKPLFKIQAHFNLGQSHYHQALETVGSSWQTAKLNDETIDKAVDQTVRSIKEFEAVLVLDADHPHAKKMKSEVELFQQKLLAKKYENKENKDQKNNPDKNKQGDSKNSGNEQQGDNSNPQSDSTNNNKNEPQNNQPRKNQEHQKNEQNDANNPANQNKQKDSSENPNEKEATDQTNPKNKNQQSVNKNEDTHDQQAGSRKDEQQASNAPNNAQADDNLNEKKKDSNQNKNQPVKDKKIDDKKDEQERQEPPGQGISQEDAPGSDVMEHALDAHAKAVLDAVEQAEGNAQKRAMAAELSKMRQAGVGGSQKPW